MTALDAGTSITSQGADQELRRLRSVVPSSIVHPDQDRDTGRSSLPARSSNRVRAAVRTEKAIRRAEEHFTCVESFLDARG